VPWIIGNHVEPSFKNASEKAVDYLGKVYEYKRRRPKTLKASYFSGAVLGCIANFWGRFYMASQFESTSAKIGAALLPEVVTGIVGLVKTHLARQKGNE